MPRKVQTDYKNNGVWAYYAYVAKKEHRKELQNKLYEWYGLKYRKDARALTMTALSAGTHHDVHISLYERTAERLECKVKDTLFPQTLVANLWTEFTAFNCYAM